jgi:hypothetical protein
VAQNSHTSSRPPSSDSPFTKPKLSNASPRASAAGNRAIRAKDPPYSVPPRSISSSPALVPVAMATSSR